jgi:hypothetical protein
MSCVVIFDLNKPEMLKDFKTFMQKNHGFFGLWTNAVDQKTIILPNNTVWRPNVTLEQASDFFLMGLNDFNRKSGITLKVDKLLVLKASPWRAI